MLINLALILVERKNLDHSIFRAHIKLGTFLTILGFPKSNARQKKKIYIFKLKMDSKSANEKHTLDSNVLNRKHVVKIKNEVTKVS